MAVYDMFLTTIVFDVAFLLLVSQYLEDNELIDLLEELINMASSSWHSRHGSVLTISSILRHKPASVCQFALFSSILGCLKSALKDEKVLLFCHCMCMIVVYC